MPDINTSFSLGDRKLEGNLFLGPMAGYTDRAFRGLCALNGAAMTCTEMVSAEGLVRDSKNTFALLEKSPYEKNLAIQLFGSNPDTFARATAKLPKDVFCAIDINCGCPVPKVVKTQAGSALLRNPELIRRLVMAIGSETDLPVTVKIRLGWDESSINYLETSDAAAQGGAVAVCLHCRTRSQFYSGKPDYQALLKLKQHSRIPVIGSGDVFSPEDARMIFQTTGCDGLLFARGAIGRPYIFRQTMDLITTGSYTEVPLKQRVELFMQQLRSLSQDRGEQSASREMRKHVPYFLKGIRNSSAVRQAVSTALSIDDYQLAFGKILDQFSL